MERTIIALPLCYTASCFAGALMSSARIMELTAAAGTVTLTLPNACMVSLVPLALAAWAYWVLGIPGAFAAVVLRGLCLGVALGASSPVLGVLLQFSGLLSGTVMVFFLLRRLELGRREMARDLVLCAGVCLFIALADTLWVAPFLDAALSF